MPKSSDIVPINIKKCKESISTSPFSSYSVRIISSSWAHNITRYSIIFCSTSILSTPYFPPIDCSYNREVQKRFFDRLCYFFLGLSTIYNSKTLRIFLSTVPKTIPYLFLEFYSF